MFAYLSSVFSKKQKNQRMVPLVEIVTIVFWDGGLILMTLEPSPVSPLSHLTPPRIPSPDPR